MTGLKRPDLLYPELSYELIGILFEICNEIGYGHQEKHYQKAIANTFKNLGIAFKEQLPCRIVCKKEKVGMYFLDFLVEDKIVIEIKRGQYFSKDNINQVYGYLKATGLKLGIIVNFTPSGVRFKRIVNIK